MTHHTQRLIIDGKTLPEWARQYGLSKQRLHQLYQKHGTISDDLMAKRQKGGGRPLKMQLMSDFEQDIVTMARKRYPTINHFSQVLELSDNQLLLIPKLGRKRLARIQQQRKKSQP